jgi:competence protein ComEC
MQWYWIYQGWFFLLLPLLTQVRWKQYGLTLGFGMIVQILFVQSMQPLSVLLFVPIGLIQAGLWLLMSVWTWLPLPLWQGMEQLLSHLFETLSVLTMFNQSWIIGTFTNVMVLSLIVGLIVMLIAWFYKHMSIFRSMSVLASVAFIFHLLAIDITLLESSLHFINVGQGDATLIRHRQHAVLIDTGGHHRVDIAEAVLIPYFRNIRLRKLDAVIITHDDFDHNGALANLRNRFPIHRVIDTRFSHATWGQIHIAQLTYDTPMDADDNEKSLVLRFQFDRCIVMVMGDASVRNEALLINRYSDLKTHILRIGHHGSNTSTSQAFLQHTQPDIAVISLSAGNRYGHPHPEVVMRLQSLGVAIRRTDIEGTIVYRRCII